MEPPHEQPSILNDRYSKGILKCIYTNARSIVNKFSEFELLIDECKPDIIGLTETWLHEDIQESEIKIPGYNTFRKDRVGKRGGGVALYVTERVKAVVNSMTLVQEYGEAIWCDVYDKDNVATLLGVVYRSPSSSPEEDQKLFDLLNGISDQHVLIMGDFNMPGINWNLMQGQCHKEEQFIDVIENNFWTQNITCATRERAILDLVLTSDGNMIDNITDREPLGSSDHLVIAWDLKHEREEVIVRDSKDFKKANYEDVEHALSQLNWHILFQECTVNKAWNIFQDEIISVIDDFVPNKQGIRKSRKNKWMTRKLLKLVRKRRKLWKKYKSSRLEEDKNMYKDLNVEVRMEIKQAKRNFERKLSENIKEDSKSFYSYIRGKTKCNESVGPLKDNDGNNISPGVDTAEALNNFLHQCSQLKNVKIYQYQFLYSKDVMKKN